MAPLPCQRLAGSHPSKLLKGSLSRYRQNPCHYRARAMPPLACSAASPAQAGSTLQVLVYSGEGAGHQSARNTLHALQRCLAPGVEARFLNTDELLRGTWRESCLLLVMPGGADLPYCRRLNGRGNRLLKTYVEAGGSYLGICAGAYYACRRVEFEPGTPLEVVGERELGFFPGTAQGAAYPGFDYASELGATAAPLRFRSPHPAPGNLPRTHCQPPYPQQQPQQQSLHHANQHFGQQQLCHQQLSPPSLVGLDEHPLTITQLGPHHLDLSDATAATDTNATSAADPSCLEAVGALEPGRKNSSSCGSSGARGSCSHNGRAGDKGGGGGSSEGTGRGRGNVDMLNDSCNGSSSSVSGGRHARTGSRCQDPANPHMSPQRQQRTSDGTAEPAGIDTGGGGGSGDINSSGGGGGGDWVFCRDYSNGGPVFHLTLTPSAAAAAGAAVAVPASDGATTATTAADAGATGATAAAAAAAEAAAGISVLAVYPQLGNALAAVRCRVGLGVAVLCGTHPELPYKSLQGAVLLYDVRQARHVAALGKELEAWEQQRRQFWAALLLACCTTSGVVAETRPAATGTLTATMAVEGASPLATSNVAG